ncbi:MAG: hypothetical protein ABII90_09770 [Bacteroidota bacterium]
MKKLIFTRAWDKPKIFPIKLRAFFLALLMFGFFNGNVTSLSGAEISNEYLVGDDDDGDDDNTPPCNNDKIEICHIPHGNPSNAHTICISPNALDAHLAHGDYEGPCDNTNPDSSITDPDSSITDSSGTFQFELSASPNPYSGYTNVQYTLPEDGFVLIEVYNQYGIKVQTIANELQISGQHSYQFSAGSLGYSPGYYLLSFSFWGSDNINHTISLLEF